MTTHFLFVRRPCYFEPKPFSRLRGDGATFKCAFYPCKAARGADPYNDRMGDNRITGARIEKWTSSLSNR
jgi:hypothetical protein